MRTRLWVVLTIGLAIAGGIVSFAVADGFDKVGISPPAMSPVATAKLKSVQWWKNGVNQGNIAFDAESKGYITVTSADFIMFKMKGYYQGTGTGYMMFWDPVGLYGESWLLQPGVTTTKIVGRVYKLPADKVFCVDVHPPGSDYYGPGDWNWINVDVT